MGKAKEDEQKDVIATDPVEENLSIEEESEQGESDD